MVTLQIQAALQDKNGTRLEGKTINFYRSTDNVNFSSIGSATTDSDGIASINDTVTEAGTYYYKAEFPGDDTYNGSEATASYTYNPSGGGGEVTNQLANLIGQLLPLLILLIIIIIFINMIK